MKDYKDFSKVSIVTTVGLEHFIIAIVLLFKLIWVRRPKWVEIFEQRRVNKSLKKKSKKYNNFIGQKIKQILRLSTNKKETDIIN